MYKRVRIKKNANPIIGSIKLSGSKSISNRALIIRALCKSHFDITNLATSKDTETLYGLLQNEEGTYDAGHAGTTFRFMTAYLSTKEGTQVLTGSERMKERPIGPLADALNSIGAHIKYLEKEGYPPLEINSPNPAWKGEIEIDGGISSQFISALLMIAPTLPNGLKVFIKGDLVSRPYLEMTLSIMEYFGVNHKWVENEITIAHQEYQEREFHVEADWSSASYLYSLVAINPESEIEIIGLSEQSLQGDSSMALMAKQLGVDTTFEKDKLVIKHVNNASDVFDYNFLRQPDLAQTLACVCVAKGIKGLFSGLGTLKIKETDRIEALKNELQKLGGFLTLLPSKFTKSADEFYLLEGLYQKPESAIETYKDHRMALAFSCFACLDDIEIEDPAVISKSYVQYWEDLEKLGFELEWLEE